MLSLLIVVGVMSAEEPPSWNSVLESWAHRRQGEVVHVRTSTLGNGSKVVSVRAAWGPDRLRLSTMKDGKTSTLDYHNGIVLDLGPKGLSRVLIKRAGRHLEYEGFVLTSALVLLWDPFVPPTDVYGPPTRITSDGDDWKCEMSTFEARTGVKVYGWINKRSLLPTRFRLTSTQNGEAFRIDIRYDFAPKAAKPDTTKRRRLPDRTEESLDRAILRSQFQHAMP